jgi:hypothetical protein
MALQLRVVSLLVIPAKAGIQFVESAAGFRPSPE